MELSCPFIVVWNMEYVHQTVYEDRKQCHGHEHVNVYLSYIVYVECEYESIWTIKVEGKMERT